MAKGRSGSLEPEPTGIADIDALGGVPSVSIAAYIAAVSAYVRGSDGLGAGSKKAAQIRLSNALARCVADALRQKIPTLNATPGERRVAGALRVANADVSEIHPLDGLRLAVELKPVNLAVGRAIWNRFGDLRTFAVNLHLKFPFAVVGGVLVVPTVERAGSREAIEAERREEADEANDSVAADAPPPSPAAPAQRSTRHLIERAAARLIRAGGRRTEADAAHLLEGIGVVAYDPATGQIDPDLPTVGSGLRWDEFINALAAAYEARFED
jgi:hypothetical protein